MFTADMRSSSTMSFEPGLEYGVPWGRDLFTFVTSAAGHMMRTLQKPRKNKPSKRQVNHRRFLHNMIQRKFAEIEAGNHQLASAIFSSDSSQGQIDGKSANKHELGKNTKKGFNDSEENETTTKQQEEVNDASTLDNLVANPNESSLKINQLNNRKNNLTNKKDSQQRNNGKNEEENFLQPSADCERELSQSAPLDFDNLTPVTNISLDESVYMWLESIERIKQTSYVHMPQFSEKEQKEQEYFGTVLCDMSPASPAVSPLSLDSCSFEMQLQPEVEHGSQIHPITESLHMDMNENFELLDCSERYPDNLLNDQSGMVWYTQSKEDQSYFQDNLSLHNISHIMDNQTDCDGGIITEELEGGSQIPMLLNNPDYGNTTCSQTLCASSFSQNQMECDGILKGVTTDLYLHLSGINTTINNETEAQYQSNIRQSDPVTWNRSEEDFEESNFSNFVLDCQVLQRHEPLNQTISNYWESQNLPKGFTPTGLIDTQYVWTDTQKSNTEVQTTQNANALASPTTHCYSFDTLSQDNSNCTRDSCSYSNGERGQGVFEGVAQSFPAPMHKPHPLPVSTPPLNDDWLFSNIVAEEVLHGVVRPPICNYC